MEQNGSLEIWGTGNFFYFDVANHSFGALSYMAELLQDFFFLGNEMGGDVDRCLFHFGELVSRLPFEFQFDRLDFFIFKEACLWAVFIGFLFYVLMS